MSTLTPGEELLVPAHGGDLVDRFVAPDEAGSLRSRAAALPALTLDGRELADLELIAIGAATPLTGFVGSGDYESVLDRLRLADGTVWPLPFTLAVPEAAAERLEPGGEAALHDEAGRLWGLIGVEEVYERDPLVEARKVYGTEDPAHPGVAYLLSRPRRLVGGAVTVLPLPALPFAEHRLTPRQMRERIRERGWRVVAGFQTRNPIHRAHEHLTKLALEFADGLVVHPLVGETKNDDVPASVRFRAYEVLLDAYYPKGRTLLAAFPAAMRYAGPREALFHAIARKNYGINRLIVGRDHAGVGRFYGPYEAQEIFDRFEPSELGVAPLKFEPTFYCRPCDSLASARTCPHDAAARVDLSGSKVRELLRSGAGLPREFTRPEIAEILREHYAGAAPVRPAVPRKPHRGFIVWFTGLSGAGKSTLAAALKERLTGRAEVLDGDEVRTNLSKGLGFSKEDRDTNIRRIGYVARLLARNGTAAVAAAIAPYAHARGEVRALAGEEGIPFVEVFATAELASLAARDVKGLYKRALAGEIPHFTGVSDPYEPPERAEVVVRTDRETVEESLSKILACLEERGLVGPEGEGHTVRPFYPVFLNLHGRKVVVVGGGAVAAAKLAGLVQTGARVTLVAEEVGGAVPASGLEVVQRSFEERDLDGAFFVVAAATPAVNRRVREAAEARGLFVNAVDDRDSATAYTGGVLRRSGVTIAVSTEGAAPALAGLLREALEALLPEDLSTWVDVARSLRETQRAQGVPSTRRRGLLLEALNRLYEDGRGAEARP